MGTSTKIDTYVNVKELADFLHDLASALENGGNEEFACVGDFQKIKIAIKNDYGQISLKAKIKSKEACVDDEPHLTTPTDVTSAPALKPKYKHLKKRMKSTFKLLVKMIHEGQMPPAEAVKDFLDDSQLMVSYPGYGDEYYESYTAACTAFAEAHAAGDITKMHETIDVLVHEKSRCHAKYD